MSVKLLLTFFVIVTSSNVCNTKHSGKVTNSTFRNKRQTETWVWGGDGGHNNDKNVESRQQETTTAAPKSSNPCDFYEPKKPDFGKGRRVSEAKCFDYIWELKNRDDRLKRHNACLQYQLSQNSTNRPHFAIGGRNTLPGEFPHMGALGWRAVIGTWIFKCGSSLISRNFLLTAAHCSKVSSADTTVANTRPEIVRLGDKNIIDKFANGQIPKDVTIKRFIVHPQYDPPKKYYDIGLIEIVEGVNFDRFTQPACLWSYPDTSPLGTRAALTGWGVVDSASRKTSPELQAAFVDIIDSNQCNEFLRPAFSRHFWGVEPHQLCAGVLAGGVDSCQGDSGGPLQVKIQLPITSQGSMSYLIGVTSFGYGCARANTPGVYTRVSSFVDWIESIVWA